MVLISYVFAVFFILAFIADRLPLIKLIGKISALSKLSLTTISSDVMGDSEKQKLLLANSAGIFKRSLKLGGLIVLILITGCLLVLTGIFFQVVKGAEVLRYLRSVNGIVISVASFCFYFLLKKIYARARL